MAKRLYQDRDECANWGVSIWKDCISCKPTWAQHIDMFKRLWESPKYKRLPQYQRAYVQGFIDSFYQQNVQWCHLESGAWVKMPDGSIQFWGTDRRNNSVNFSEIITHRYIYENAIVGKKGLYWYGTNGTKPYHVVSVEPIYIPTSQLSDPDTQKG